MSRLRRFGGHEAVICIFQSLREYQHIARGGFLSSLFLDFTCDKFSLVLGCVASQDPKSACPRSIRRGSVRTIITTT